MKELNRFRQFLAEEDFKNPILDKYLELKKSIDYKTVFPTDLQSFVDSLDNTEREGLENDLAEGVVKENEEQGYTLYDTKVEYDNGKTGYMFQLVNSEDREENEIGFDQLFFDDEDNRLEMGVDFNSFDQGSYQEGEYTADEAMELYRKISEGVVKENYKNDYANSEEDYTDEMVVEKIKDIIKYHELDPQDVIDEIRIEFGVDAMD